MKIGMRTPSVKRSITARTTGRMTRAVKSSVNPLYGKRGMGIVNNPRKAIYNKVYSKTTVGIGEGTKIGVRKSQRLVTSSDSQLDSLSVYKSKTKKQSVFKKKGFWIGFGIFNSIGIASMISTANIGGMVFFALLVFVCWKKFNTLKNTRIESIQKPESVQSDEKAPL